MSKIFITSDLHFCHNKPFLYEPRGFTNIYEHDSIIIKNWNSVVDIDDDVYVLGDLMLNNNELGITNIKNLKGKIHVVRGNHDSKNRIALYQDCYNIVEITEGQFLKYGKYHFYLSHYPCLTSNHDMDKPLKVRIISLCGHRHDKNKFCEMDKGLIYHTELDAHNCYPVLIDNIIEDIKSFLSMDKNDQIELIKNGILY